MLITDFFVIGNNLYKIRKNEGLTQAEVAEKAELSDRTYADIERGCVNMRVETLLKICKALRITPDEVLTVADEESAIESEIAEKIAQCSRGEKQTALKLLSVYLNSLS